MTAVPKTVRSRATTKFRFPHASACRRPRASGARAFERFDGRVSGREPLERRSAEERLWLGSVPIASPYRSVAAAERHHLETVSSLPHTSGSIGSAPRNPPCQLDFNQCLARAVDDPRPQRMS